MRSLKHEPPRLSGRRPRGRLVRRPRPTPFERDSTVGPESREQFSVFSWAVRLTQSAYAVFLKTPTLFKKPTTMSITLDANAWTLSRPIALATSAGPFCS